MRADQLLLARGSCRRAARRRLIERGAAQWRGPRGWVACAKAGEELADDAVLRSPTTPNCAGRRAPGSSSTRRWRIGHRRTRQDLPRRRPEHRRLHRRCCSRAARRRVVGFDVGRGPASSSRLRGDRASRRSKASTRGGSPLAALRAAVAGFDLVVADLSFISLAGAAPRHGSRRAAMRSCSPSRSSRCSRPTSAKGGIVRDAMQLSRIEPLFADACRAVGWKCAIGSPAPSRAATATTEFFVRGAPKPTPEHARPPRPVPMSFEFFPQHAGRQREAASAWWRGSATLARVLQRHVRRRRLDAREDAQGGQAIAAAGYEAAAHVSCVGMTRASPARFSPPTARRTSGVSSRCAATCPAARRARASSATPRSWWASSARAGRGPTGTSRSPPIPSTTWTSATPCATCSALRRQDPRRRRLGDHAVLLQCRRVLPLRRADAKARRDGAGRAGRHAVPQLRQDRPVRGA